MNKQILIIEDDKSLGPIIGDYLGFEGYGVEIAECGEEALGLLDYEKPALVLLDYNLPGLNGLEVLKTLSKRRPGLPVIMMTGCGSEHVAVEAMKSGAADYLVKPFQLDALKLVIDSTLRLRRHGDQPAATTTPAAMGEMDNQMRRRSTDNRAFHGQDAAVAKAEGAPLPTLATAPARMPGASGAMLASIRIAQKLVAISQGRPGQCSECLGCGFPRISGRWDAASTQGWQKLVRTTKKCLIRQFCNLVAASGFRQICHISRLK